MTVVNFLRWTRLLRTDHLSIDKGQEQTVEVFKSLIIWLVILIIMKAMYFVTAVINMSDRGGEQLWKTSHWTFIRSTPGHE
jgi:hypothetical protein